MAEENNGNSGNGAGGNGSGRRKVVAKVRTVIKEDLTALRSELPA